MDEEGREEIHFLHYLCILYLLEAHLIHDDFIITSYTILTQI